MSIHQQPKRKRITLAAVGGPPPLFPAGAEVPTLVQGMVEHWREHISTTLPSRPDLILLPEMCDRFRATPRELLPELRWMIAQAMLPMLAATARENGCYIAYPTATQSAAGAWHNAVRLLDRHGIEKACYLKNFLVPTEIENGLSPGSEPLVYDCDFGRVGFAICFDLNFTELLERYRALNPDLLLFPSNYHGGLMQPYWAYQLRAHFLGCMGQATIRSTLYSPTGALLASSTNYFHHLTVGANLDCAVVHLDFHWEKLRALKAHFARDVTLSDPGELGAILITSEHPELPVTAMLEQFEIQTLDSYLARSRSCNATAPTPCP